MVQRAGFVCCPPQMICRCVLPLTHGVCLPTRAHTHTAVGGYLHTRSHGHLLFLRLGEGLASPSQVVLCPHHHCQTDPGPPAAVQGGRGGQGSHDAISHSLTLTLSHSLTLTLPPPPLCVLPLLTLLPPPTHIECIRGHAISP